MLQLSIKQVNDNMEFKEYKNTRYFVNKKGVVIGRRGNILEGKPFWRGKYLSIHIDKEYKLIHRMIAETFIENPNNLKTVNHKDGNIYNNSVDNLEWMSFSDNMKHSYKNLNRISAAIGNTYMKGKTGHMKDKFGKNCPNSKKVFLYNMNMSLIKEFESGREAALYLNVKPASITRNCTGVTKTCKNHILSYNKFDNVKNND